METRMRAPALALLLAGCATVAGTEDEPYRALGTEPFWSITVAGRRMTYETPEGGFSVPAPRPQETGDGRIYETRRITLHIWHGECSDGMSDNRYSQTVRAVVDGRELRGCGGAVLAPATLAGTHWSIVAIDGEAVSGEAYRLQFDAERLSGQAGCNRFSGGYAVSGNRLTSGPIMATRMACPEPRMRHERRVLQVLSGPVTVGYADGGTLLLNGNGGTIRLRRSI